MQLTYQVGSSLPEASVPLLCIFERQRLCTIVRFLQACIKLWDALLSLSLCADLKISRDNSSDTDEEGRPTYMQDVLCTAE